MLPNLLEFDNGYQISDNVFADLRMNKVFSAKTLRVLAHPCTYSTIEKRQEVFEQLLDSEDFEIQVSEAMTKLRDFNRAYTVCNDAKDAIRKKYLFVRALEAYADACDCLASFSGSNALCSAVGDWFSSGEQTEYLTKLREDLASLRKLLTESSDFVISHGERTWLCNDESPSDYIMDIADIATEMGFEIRDNRKLHISIDETLSHAIGTLYQDKIEEIDQILLQYQSIDKSAFSTLADELAFFEEICSLVRSARVRELPVCIPEISYKRKFTATAIYDISLLSDKNITTVTNNCDFDESENVVFLVGANGGGKTTYLRALGINLILALAGCPIFARSGVVYPFTNVLTHFPDDEHGTTGRLDGERIRINELIESSDNDAFMLLNEIYSSTDEVKGFEMLRDLVTTLKNDGRFALCVTHFQQVMNLDFPVLAPVVDGEIRTFKIERKYGVASSHAVDILKKYRLDKDSLAERENGKEDPV